VFTNGAWIKGRIYEDKCDLSPDGKLFVYFVHQGSRAGTEFTDSWTAISRPPWLHALAAWPQGTTYGGGGRFVDNQKLALRGVWHEPLKALPEYKTGRIEIVKVDTELQHDARNRRCRLVWPRSTESAHLHEGWPALSPS